jgi:organic hydroperoxide reductase OsmC/OhrA
MGLVVSKLAVKVTIELEGDPLVAKRAEMTVSCELADGACPEAVIERAKARCTVAHSLRAGLEVVIS